MSDKLTMNETFRFDAPGTLEKPGPIGRLVRLGSGVLCLWLVWQLAVDSNTSTLRDPAYLLFAFFCLMLAPYVVNIGFGVKWGAWPRIVSLGILVAGVIVSYAFAGNLLDIPLWATATTWMVYIYAHLGISFVLSALLATPGCEMRAIPHLIGILSGKTAIEHYCPGYIDNVDRWEAERHGGTEAVESPDGAPSRSRDILGSTGKILLFYGVPFIILQIAGNFGGFTVATAVPATAFFVMSIVCIINAWRSRRVHCFFLGPWFIVAGTATALYSLRLIDFGSGSWSLIVNTGLGGAVLIYMGTERLWGKYFKRGTD